MTLALQGAPSLERAKSSKGDHDASPVAPSGDRITTLINDACGVAVIVHLLVLVPMFTVPLRHQHDRGPPWIGTIMGLHMLALGHLAMSVVVFLMARRVARATTSGGVWASWTQLAIGAFVAVAWIARVQLALR